MLLILLLKIVKKSVQFALKLKILSAFQSLQESKLNVQNSGLSWPIRSQNFDFQIAITFIF